MSILCSDIMRKVMRGYEVPGCQLLLRRAGFPLGRARRWSDIKDARDCLGYTSRTVVPEVQPVTMDRFQHANELRLDQAGDLVKLAGRVTRVKDLGGLSFLHLQDTTGVVQVVADPNRVPTTSELRVGVLCVRRRNRTPPAEGNRGPVSENRRTRCGC